MAICRSWITGRATSCIFLFSLYLATTVVHCVDYNQVGLKAHNHKRSLHDVPPLKLDSDLKKQALKCAEYYASNQKMDHSCPHKTTDKFPPDNEIGENIFRNKKVRKATKSVTDAVEKWYDEIEYWDFDKSTTIAGRKKYEAFHFTQMVWKSTTKLGMGYATNPKYGTIVVALYGPAGNIVDDIAENVPTQVDD